ncbi:conjugation TrbI family protein [Caballeronia fortuita]|uniref:Conjugation TrbI family protein n=1 Tax=Caballeronia fortuita TaxID=1777138 RepID=A0A158CLU4_9BURK|nr:TrbI/VirB10 family protein [Caballeronia fortuita]SAK83239.1 conjugation TrbI family protein [Caballeronia fortuita]
MVDPNSKAPDDREAAVREWEKQANASMVADNRKKRLGGVAIAGIATAAIAAVWLVKHSGNDTAKAAANSDISIPDRKPVPKLKERETASASSVAAAPAATPASAVQADDPMKAQREQMEMQRREQARRLIEARMKSAIIPPNSANQPAGAQPQTGAEVGGQVRQNAVMLGGSSGDQGPQDSNSRFARSVSGSAVPVSMASQIDNLPYKVLQGEFIEAVLEPRAISDLPGQLCALVQRDVYGTQGRLKLIPWGSRVCGTYNAELRKGQDRLFVVWNTLRRPDGVQVAIDSAGSDQLGTAGMGGIVDTHFAEIFGMSALLSIIGAGASNVGVSSGDQYNSASQYRQSVQQAASQSSQQVLSPYINIQPTVTVPAGSRVRIYVNKDLDFTSIYKDQIDAQKHVDGVTFIQ